MAVTHDSGREKTMHPLERAARALCENLSEDPDELVEMTSGPVPRWQSQLPQVHAVLTALREPTEDMIEQGALNLSDARECWQAMVDAALAESWEAMRDAAES